MHLSRLHYTLLINLTFHLFLVVGLYYLVSSHPQQQLLSSYCTALLFSPFLGLLVVKGIDLLPFDPVLGKHDWTMAYTYIRKLKGGHIKQDAVDYAQIISLVKFLEFWLIVPYKGLKYLTHFIQSLAAINWLFSLSKSTTTTTDPPMAGQETAESLELLSPPCLWIDEPPPTQNIDREDSINKMNEYVRANPGAFIARCILTQCWRFKSPQPRTRVIRNTPYSPSPLSKTLYI
ncbi:hypothetical protein TRICI_005802 [Trichomonascus ciferrii]|uniref:Uncharacterized protein n=1 Tax=Trichomonascus ciferrii TaxID=44093 RepID=A0A642UPJ9_9ASCO|nr:hypothetical protein TRICI_005802 [Trichomonascus ciferrii]